MNYYSQNSRLTKTDFFTGGNGDVDDSEYDVQDYSNAEDYNDVFDSTTNGWVLYTCNPSRLIVLSRD